MAILSTRCIYSIVVSYSCACNPIPAYSNSIPRSPSWMSHWMIVFHALFNALSDAVLSYLDIHMHTWVVDNRILYIPGHFKYIHLELLHAVTRSMIHINCSMKLKCDIQSC